MSKILICMPCMSTIPIQTVGSLLALDKPDGSEFYFVSNSLVYDARNECVQNAINGGFDYVLFIDSDMVFPKDSIERLINRNVDIVTGVYYARRGNHFPVIFSKVRPKSFFRKQIATKIEKVDKPFFEVAGCGMGLCLIKTEVFKKMYAKKWEPFRPMRLLGEDLSFCYRASKLGYKIYADSTIELGHIGDKIYTKRDYNERDNI